MSFSFVIFTKKNTYYLEFQQGRISISPFRSILAISHEILDASFSWWSLNKSGVKLKDNNEACHLCLFHKRHKGI